MKRRSVSGNNTEQVLQSQITDLQDNIVITGSNLSVGRNWLAQNTTSNNTAIGYQTLTGSTADNNTAVGCQAHTSSTTGYLNTGVYVLSN